MVSDFIKIGTKMDIMPDDVSLPVLNEEQNTVFHSKVQDLFSNGDLEVDMPSVNGKLILLHNGVRYRIVFYTETATYVVKAEVVDRYKSNNMFLLRLRILTQFEKFQRREYFRCECMLDIKYISVTEEEVELMEEARRNDVAWDTSMISYFDGVALDISGGGVRFTSKRKLEQGSLIHILFSLKIGNQLKEFQVVGKVLSSTAMENSNRRFENRIQFSNMRNDDRELIIRYIFEQERKSRKLANGR